MKRLLPIGTRSLLFGVHQFLWHPITVYIAWTKLYGLPSWKETVCILIHDLGYIGKPDMDGPSGLRHPELGAKIAGKLFGSEYFDLVLGHSRSYARLQGEKLSKLCWADKLSIKFDPWWLYLPRAWISGELIEYRAMADQTGFVDENISHRGWFKKLRECMAKQAKEEGRKQYRVESTQLWIDVQMASIQSRY